MQQEENWRMHIYMVKIKKQVKSLELKLAGIGEETLWSDNLQDYSSALPVPPSMHAKLPYVTKGWHKHDMDASVRHVFETLAKLYVNPAWQFV
jgi:hypothetical protein